MTVQLPHSGRFWIISLSVVIGLFIAATVGSVFIAKSRGGRVVDSEYYSHGLHYAENHSKSGNAGNSWTMTPSVDGTFLQVVVRDESGQPLRGADALYTLEQNAATPAGTVVTLTESSPGLYRCPKPTTSRGELRGMVRVSKGGGSITGRVVVIN